MRAMDELRPLTAGRLLELWRECREMEDPLERVLWCNGRIAAECCFLQGERVYESAVEVREDLTGRQLENLLRRLAQGGGSGENRRREMGGGAENPAFDGARFEAMRGE